MTETVTILRGEIDADGNYTVAEIVMTAAEYAAMSPPVPVMTLAERKAAMIAAVDARRDTVLAGGYTVTDGPMAGKVLQTRDIEDRTNWLISQGSYSAAVAAGQGAVPGARFRTSDNVTYTLTFAEGLAVLLGMAAWGASVMDLSWSLKDAVAAAEDMAALDAIDIEAGWP